MLTSFLQLVQATLVGVGTVQRWLGLWQPLASSGPALLGPFLALSSILVLALLTGVAAGALAVLIVVLLALYLLLTDVLGVTIDVNPA